MLISNTEKYSAVPKILHIVSELHACYQSVLDSVHLSNEKMFDHLSFWYCKVTADGTHTHMGDSLKSEPQESEN